MPLNADYLSGLVLPDIQTTISDQSAMLYALSIGIGRDPLDARDLHYVFERDLSIFPTMPVIIGHPGNWLSDPKTGVTMAMVLHGAQIVKNLAPLRVGRRIVARNRVTGLADKGTERGAILKTERTLHDLETGTLLAVLESLIFCRADGGFGYPNALLHAFQPVPAGEPDFVVEVPIAQNAALIYRLNHDRNPIHADPLLAASAGFSRPILHGLCTFGVSVNALSKVCGDAPIALAECRFSKPVLPGETLVVEGWRQPDGVSFRSRVNDRTVIDMGKIGFAN